LANTLGNLVNRTIAMSNKYFDGVMTNAGAKEPVDDELAAFALETVRKVDERMEKLRVADAITEIFNLFKRCNKYIDETMPWALAKDESKKDRLATVLYNLVEGITFGATLLTSFMPETAERIVKQLNTSIRSLDELTVFGTYPSGQKVTDKPEILFARLDAKKVLAEIDERFAAAPEEKETADDSEKTAAAADQTTEATDTTADSGETAGDVIDLPAKDEITFDDFSKLQFQVGEILSCEAVKKSRKLLCSQVKVGSQVKQIVSGIKSSYSPEEMVGKKVMVVTNLKPAKLAGLLSEGMILCAEDAEGKLSLVVPEREMPAGAEIC
ncbi:MAG: methionine--tRNA ligase subunit beta, partial [Lachnospiraceae bacterium]|nr:methionine--tRNA ligase subunit beta [Lachnospiraceae bacterium]